MLKTLLQSVRLALSDCSNHSAQAHPARSPSIKCVSGAWLLFATVGLAAFSQVPSARAQSSTPKNKVSIEVGQSLPELTLSGDAGGLVSGEDWSSKEMLGKLHLLFYVDPDKRNANTTLEQAFKKANFPPQSLGSVAVINMAASMIPNFILSSAVRSKQKDFPDTVYVKDYNSALVKKWGLADDAYVMLVVDSQGKLLLTKQGVFDQKQSNEIVATVRGFIDSQVPAKQQKKEQATQGS